MRVCLAYDCLFPWTVGGHERYLRTLAEGLAERGHDVTYITRRQWPVEEDPDLEDVSVIAVSREEPLYDATGRRRVAEAVNYGIGVFRHLVRSRRRYDVVHLVGFPYFSLLAARAALVGTSTRIVVDWPEVWSRSYWREYLGRLGGPVGHLVQRLCVRATPQAFVFSDLHARRLEEEGMRGQAVRLPGPVAGELQRRVAGTPAVPLVLYAGRMIPEKRAHLVPEAVAVARSRIPGLRSLVLGDGPERERVLAAISELDVGDVIEAPGFVSADEVAEAFGRATCLLAPSSREGFGLVVVEAAASGTPSIVVRGPDNAMVERIVAGTNGFVVDDPDAAALADAIVAAHEGGVALRESTAQWFAEERRRLDPALITATVARAYRG